MDGWISMGFARAGHGARAGCGAGSATAWPVVVRPRGLTTWLDRIFNKYIHIYSIFNIYVRPPRTLHSCKHGRFCTAVSTLDFAQL